MLRDEERRRIYDTCGWEGLVKAEQYSEVSVFDEDAFEQYESFFSGEDEDDRQYLLIHGETPHFHVAMPYGHPIEPLPPRPLIRAPYLPPPTSLLPF